MSNKDILESIKKCEGFVGAVLKIKRSRYEIIDYDYYLGFVIKKISVKKKILVSEFLYIKWLMG